MKLDIRLGYNLHPAENRTVKKRKKRCADSISRLLGRNIPVKKVSQSIKKAPISFKNRHFKPKHRDVRDDRGYVVSHRGPLCLFHRLLLFLLSVPVAGFVR